MKPGPNAGLILQGNTQRSGYHQQQIREAVGEPLLDEDKWIYPLIDTFVRGVPNVYQKLFPDDNNSIVAISINDIDNTGWILKEE